MIGGRIKPYENTDVIAKYENNRWSIHGNLQKSRDSHGSITSSRATIVIGGYAFSLENLETETWNIIDGDTRFIDPTLRRDNYQLGIGLYLVPEDFCRKQ